jgi:hypothetical protein
MKVLTGHITATERKAVNAMIANGWQFAETKSMQFELTAANGVYSLKTKKRDRGLIPCAGSAIRTSVYVSTFTI